MADLTAADLDAMPHEAVIQGDDTVWQKWGTTWLGLGLIDDAYDAEGVLRADKHLRRLVREADPADG